MSHYNQLLLMHLRQQTFGNKHRHQMVTFCDGREQISKTCFVGTDLRRIGFAKDSNRKYDFKSRKKSNLRISAIAEVG